MKKSVLAGIIIGVIILGGGGILLAMYGSSKTKTSTGDMSNMDMSSAGKDGAGLGDSSDNATTNTIAIQDFAYSPGHTTVKVGTTVTWTNKDNVAHTVTSSDGPETFDSGSVGPGKTYSFTFTKAGDYKYFCQFHPSMPSATITVTE